MIEIKCTTRNVLACAALAALVAAASPASAQTAPALGTVAGFAVLAGSAVTSTGPTVVTGDLGVSPGSAVTGFPPGIVTGGVIHAADATAAQAQVDLTTAYNAVAGQSCTADLTGVDLGGLTLTPGVYCFSSSAQLTGTLTLNAQGNAAAVFIFKTGSSLTTASGARVAMINGGIPCNVYWQIGSSATLGTTTQFGGNILALSSITLNTGANVAGRLLARNGSITLDSNRIVNCAGQAACAAFSVLPATFPAPVIGVPYSQALTGSGGTGPYTFGLYSGALPPGLALSIAGVITGTPTSSGIFPSTLLVLDAAGCGATRSFGGSVNADARGIPALAEWALLLACGLLGASGASFAARRQRVGRRT